MRRGEQQLTGWLRVAASVGFMAVARAAGRGAPLELSLLFDGFKANAPGRFFNCGVAEANMMSVAAGMALSGLRPVVYTIARETHDADLPPGGRSAIRHGFGYSDGSGRMIQSKAQVEALSDATPRWVGSGWTVFDNKGQPVRTFEPFFSCRL